MFVVPLIGADAASKNFNVRNYGAIGDGKADDTAAIKAAIAAAGINTANTVLFPPGSYRYTDYLVANGITLRGQTGARLTSDSAQAYVRLTGRNGGVIGFRFDTESIHYPLNPLILDFAGNFTVSDNVFALGINLLRDWDIVVENSSFRGTIANNKLEAPGGIKLINSHEISISGNDITGRTNGIYAEGCEKISCISNKLHSSTFLGGTGIELRGEDSDMVRGNTVKDFGYGVYVVQGSSCRVEGNELNCPVTTGAQAAIYCFNVNGMNVERNRILRANLDGIKCSSCRSDVVISQNTLSDCGLGATLFPNAAVIFAEPNETHVTSIRIVGNRYTGSTYGLNYFVECKQSAPPAVVSGNTTNTMLPNSVGP